MVIYASLKLIHIACVFLSISLFLYRYGQISRFPDKPLAKALRILPHVNDTILLSAAIGMLVVMRLNPFTTPWLAAKLLALPLYIGLGAMCLRAAPGSRRSGILFVAAMIVFGYIVLVARSKQLLPF